MREKMIVLLIFLSFSGAIFAQTTVNPVVSTEISQARQLIKAKDWTKAKEILGKFTKDNPASKTGWSLLAISQHYSTDYKNAVLSYERALAISKDYLNAYNLACSYSQLNNKDKAFEWLDTAIQLGFPQTNLVKTDSDLNNIRDDKRYEELLTKLVKASQPCMYKEENRQFDFWVGEWNVFIRGQKVGESSVTSDAKGCTLVEDWKPATGQKGKGLHAFDPVSNKWKQFYVGSSGGGVLEFIGVYENGVLKFERESVNPNGGMVKHLLSFHNLPDKTVRQHGQLSNDGGKTWQTTWDAIYFRKSKKEN